ncbi:hypothetical protein [Weissella confusa]|jgi:hypothetical protein|uniref:hypothetical protein n=1 Tax=Weissella confusa TaxID=1583 RepID=UPI00107EFC2F|nr:hypothetical protein [Weissella confusa]MBJ7620022.1 hypothetical protein [Weissella confusa]MBJ7628182.1 hypothetical protein [Weissella confusa]MBJ7667357.1 hypothetical protein [Weissella confusa]TGE49199.1 hypothetical protein C6P23_03600 [Weissella confusa]TGE67117.1 hypothetical protein C6P17_02565 [Weissella confusa]
MLYIALWAAFGGFALMIIAINLLELLKWIWFKVIGPAIYYSLAAIYYVVTGDADALPRR